MGARANDENLAPTEFGRFIDACQRFAGLVTDSDTWWRELSALVEQIPSHLTEPQLVVVQGVLWRLIVHAHTDRAGTPTGAFIPGEVATAAGRPNGARRRGPAPRDGDPRIHRALKYVAANHANPRLTLALVAAHVNLSRWHFDRLLKKRTGSGFRRHLTTARMARAQELLAATSLEIKEVSARVGYTHVSEFDRHFRLWFGVTPTCFRGHGRGGVPRNDR